MCSEYFQNARIAESSAKAQKRTNKLIAAYKLYLPMIEAGVKEGLVAKFILDEGNYIFV